MTREKLQSIADEFSDNSLLNYFGRQDEAGETLEDNNYAKNNIFNRGTKLEQIYENDVGGLLGMRFYQRPIFSIGRADNPDFEKIKQPEVVGSHHLMPEDWLPGAKSVISFFLPFERAMVELNKVSLDEPALEWVCTRVDGQRFLLSLGAKIRDALIAEGYKAIAPYTEDKYIMHVNENIAPGTEHVPGYSTNWSERHVGVVTGLGTFGLSTNFISRVGSAGRLISIITDWETTADVPDYTDWLGYCNRCGACIRKCPGQAHFKDRHGKDHGKCGAFIRKACEKFAPRYGCGKCQSGIPCEYKPMRP